MNRSCEPALVRSVADLRILAAEIKTALNAGEEATRRGLEYYRDAGIALLKAKDVCGHGNRLPWLEKNGIAPQRASECMRLARGWSKLPPGGNLKDALRLLAEDSADPEGLSATPTSATPFTNPAPSAPLDAGDNGEPPSARPTLPAATTANFDETVSDLGNGQATPVLAGADSGPEVSERLRPYFASVLLFEQAVRRAEGLANLYQEIEQTLAYLKAVEGK